MPRRNSPRVVSSSCCISAAISFMPCMIFGEASGGLVEHVLHFVRGFLVNRRERLAGALALLLGTLAHEFVLLLDRLHAFIAGVGDNAERSSRAARSSRCRAIPPFEQARRNAPDVDRKSLPCVRRVSKPAVSIFTCRLASESSVLRLLVSSSSTASASDAAVRTKLVGKVAEVGQHLRGHGIECTQMLFDFGSGCAALAAQIVGSWQRRIRQPASP